MSSLAVYQRVSDREKLAMGNSIASHISSASSGTLALRAPEVRLALPAPDSRSALPGPETRLSLPAPEIRPEAQDISPALPGPVIDVTEGEYTHDT